MIALEALGYGCHDGGLNFAVCAHLLAGVIPIAKYGSASQKKDLASYCDGSLILVNAMTESGAGSNISGLKTTARKDSGNYIINGVKTFSSNGPVANKILLYALTDESKGFFGGITAFLINADEKGVRIGQRYEKMGLRTCLISELLFENVSVSEEHVLGSAGGGTVIFNYSMDWERCGMAACHAGTMKRLLEQTITYAQTRHQGEQPIGKNQAVAHRIADMKVMLEASRLLCYKAAWNLDQGHHDSADASVAKLFVSESFNTAALTALNIHGGNGYMTAYELERIVRDAIGSTIYSGTSDIQRNIISRWLGL
jgi:alkylation response protein AidB-like acyl-CoA dehydrogenase